MSSLASLRRISQPTSTIGTANPDLVTLRACTSSTPTGGRGRLRVDFTRVSQSMNARPGAPTSRPWKHFEDFSMRRDRHRLVTRRHPSNGSYRVRPPSSLREPRGSASGWNTGFVNRLTYDHSDFIRSGDRWSQRSPVGRVRPFAACCAAEVGRDVQRSQNGGGSCSALLARRGGCHRIRKVQEVDKASRATPIPRLMCIRRGWSTDWSTDDDPRRTLAYRG